MASAPDKPKKGVANFFKSALTVLLFGMLIVAFVAWGGMQDSFKASANDTVVAAGKRTINEDKFKQIFDNELKTQNDKNPQQPMTTQQAVDIGADRQILSSLGTEESIYETVRRLGVVPGPKLVTDELRKTPEFFDPITGKFDQKAYMTALRGAGLTFKDYEAQISDNLAMKHFGAGMGAGIKAPHAYAAFLAEYEKVSRTISYFPVSTKSVAAPAKPTDAQLAALETELSDRLKLPEARALTFVRFSAKALAPTMTVDQAEIEKQYNFRKDAESKPETRTLVQVQAKDEAQAKTIADRLSKGEDPQAVAKAMGVNAIQIADKPKTGIPDAKVAAAAFSLTAGQTSGPIKGDLGWAVVKLTAITPPQVPDLKDLRPQLEMQAKQQAAEQKVTEQADKFDNAHSTGADIAKAAAAAGVQPVTTDPVVAQGVTLENKPVAGLTPKMMETAFKLAQGAESDITSDGRGEYFVVRVDKIVPPALPPIEKIKPQLEKYYMDRDLDTRMKAKADELAGRLRKGENIDTVAGAIGAKVEHHDGVDIAGAQPLAAVLGGQLLQSVLQGKPGEVFSVPGPQPRDPKAPVEPLYFVAKLDAISPGVTDATAQLAAQIMPQLSQQLGQELSTQVAQAVPAIIKPKTYPDRAKRALGVEVTDKKGKAG